MFSFMASQRNALRCIVTLAVLLAAVKLNAGESQINVGGRAAPGTPGEVYWHRFADGVADSSDGRLQVRLMIRGEIGPEETIFAHLRRGRRVQLAGVSSTAIAPLVPELDLLRLPFLFESIGEVGYILDEILKEPVAAMLKEHDLIMFDWMSAGWLNLYAKTPIIKPDDIRGQRMRVNASDAALMFMKTVNADIVPIPFNEVVPALQTNLIDGGEQSTQLFITGGVGKFAPHFSRTHHAFFTAIIVANGKWFRTLSPQDQLIYRKSLPTDAWYRQAFTKGNNDDLRRAAAEGLTIHDLTAEDRVIWRERTAHLREQLIEKIGGRSEQLYRMILDGKAAFAAREEGS